MANRANKRQLERLDALITQGEGLDPAAHPTAWVERARALLVDVWGAESDQVKRWDGIRWRPGAVTNLTPSSAWANARIAGLNRSLAVLRALSESLHSELDPPDDPTVGMTGLHSWVTDAASSLWNDGHYVQAVQAASSIIETRLRAKLGKHTGSAASLFPGAFSPEAPKKGNPRLRFSGFDPQGSDVWKSAHEGVGSFGRGCMLRIRNLASHGTGMDDQTALESLAALSLLARWLDEAELVTAD